MNLQSVLNHLSALVACNTQNPPREIFGDSAIFDYCARTVGSAFETRCWDHGEGHVSWMAVKGRPQILFNVHLDTVPSGEGWSTDPLELVVKDGKAFGRGACDIKGAAAVLLELAQSAEHLALLFTSDEEGAGGCCVANFLQAGHGAGFDQVIVAEPTGCEAVLGHRGYLSVKGWFDGTPGHSSEARALKDNANHRLANWASAAVATVDSERVDDADPGPCFNIGRIEGGTKSNVIAGDAFVHWSARLAPGESNQAFFEKIKGCGDDQARWEIPFTGDPLPAEGQDGEHARRFCRQHQISVGANVDFWTEAALFSAAGLSAMVLGPGHIEQAHITNEWVATEQLERIHRIYAEVIKHDG